MVIDAAHSHIFISRPSDNAVDVLSFTDQLLKTITGETDPWGMVVDPATESLYVTDANAEIGKIGLVSLDALSPVSTSASLTGVRSLALVGGVIWTAVGSQFMDLASVSPSTGDVTVFDSAGTIYQPWLQASPTDSAEFYAGTQGASPASVDVVTVSAGVPTIAGATLDGGQTLEDMAVTSNGDYVAVAHGSPYNFNLDSTTGGAEITLPGAAYPESVATSPGQGGLVATADSNDGIDNVSVYQVGSTSPLVQATTVSYAGARAPLVHGLAISPTGSLVFALSQDGASVVLQEFALTLGNTTTHVVALPEYPDAHSITNVVAVVTYPTGDTAGGQMAFGPPGAEPVCFFVPVVQVGAYGAAICQLTDDQAGTYVVEASYTGFHEARGSEGTTSIFFHNPGYRTVGSTGTVDTFNVTPHGSHTGPIPSPIIGMGADRETGGYWLVSARGDVYDLEAAFHGSLPLSHITVSRPVRALAGTATGLGYWILDANGTVYTYGDAINFGHVVNVPESGATVALVPTADDGGYWILGSQGEVFPFGDAESFGDLLTRGIDSDDIIGMAATPNDGGYVIAGSNGSAFAFGNAVNHGTLAGRNVGSTIGVAMDPATGGYWLAVAGGGVYNFDAPWYGSAHSSIVGIVTG
jgi:hypothetical protein